MIMEDQGRGVGGRSLVLEGRGMMAVAEMLRDRAGEVGQEQVVRYLHPKIRNLAYIQ